MQVRAKKEIRAYYAALIQAWGPQHWWPAESAFEVIVGAYLTQNTAWTNVEKALGNLRSAGLLTIKAIRGVSVAELQRLIRPAGYFRLKAERLKLFVDFLDTKYGGSLNRMFEAPTKTLRDELLGLNGVGPETADSILLYAGNHPVFVVDAYTQRIAARHQLLPESARYDETQHLFQEALSAIVNLPVSHVRNNESARRRETPNRAHPPSRMSSAERPTLAQIYNEMHGLIVGVGKHYCRKSQPECDGCPLRSFLPSHK